MRALQEWVEDLSVMQQSVLMSAIRSHDGFEKYHQSKPLMRWYRRCVLISAFDGKAITNPYEAGGGSFTGPSCNPSSSKPDGGDLRSDMQQVVDLFMTVRDAMSLHFFAHTMHAFEILGYKHPDAQIRSFWCEVYYRMAHALHVWPEMEEQMDSRLGDNEAGWADRADEAGSCSV
jgi:hypothetical protein